MAILYFELDADGAPGLLGRTLREFGQQVRQVEAHKAETMPLDLDEVHGVVVSGGGSSTGASAGAIEAYVREAVKRAGQRKRASTPRLMTESRAWAGSVSG